MQNIANASFPEYVFVPKYDRKNLKTKIVHFGVGAFHRAHQAFFLNRLLNQEMCDFGICALSILPNDPIIPLLRKQNHLYSVLEKSKNEKNITIVGSIIESLCLEDGICKIIEKLCEPQIEIVSLTITEKGYCSLPNSQGIDWKNPAILHDLENINSPKSAIGFLTLALLNRKKQNLSAFTVLSCDNIPHNGNVVKRAVLDFANKIDPDLAKWIEENVRFPNTMVDRIAPAATDESLKEVQSILGGIFDPCAVVTEAFIQWVIEDNFVSAHPNLEKVGVQFVQNVIPFEEMKLRMLNGSHSFLAYLGYLAGYKFIDECMENQDFYYATKELMLTEQMPTLSIQGIDLPNYANQLLFRFENKGLKHKTWQIAMDGSQKLPQRILESICFHLKKGNVPTYLILAVAAWMRYISGIDDLGEPIEIIDPKIQDIKLCCENSNDDENRVLSLLKLTEIFNEDLSKNKQFIKKLTQFYLELKNFGAKKTLNKINQESTK